MTVLQIVYKKNHKEKCDPHEFVVCKTNIQCIRWDGHFPSCHFCWDGFFGWDLSVGGYCISGITVYLEAEGQSIWQ